MSAAGNLDAPTQQLSRTPSPHLQPGPPANVGGTPANFYPGGPGQPPTVSGPGNFGNPPPTGSSVHQNTPQIGSGAEQQPPTAFSVGKHICP